VKKQLCYSKFSALAAMGAALCIVAALFLGCANPLAAPPETPAAGYGSVTVNLAGGAARTVFPALSFDNYSYSFTKSGGDAQAMEPGQDGKFTLEAGQWTVEVKAYAGAAEEANLAAAGATEFTVTHGVETPVTVRLAGITESGSGTFKYRIQYPAGAELTDIAMEKLKLSDSDPALTVDMGDPAEASAPGATVISKTTDPVSAGFYLVSVRLAMNGMSAGRNVVAHIYNNMTSEFGTDESPVVFTAADFAYSGAPNAPAAPVIIAADRQLAANWTAVENATAYEMWYGTTNNTGSAQKFGDDETGISKTITGLSNGTTYYVWVKAKNSAGTSAFSPAATGTPLAAAAVPAAPAAPTLTAGDRQLTASWTAAAGATAYELWYGTTNNTESAQKSGDDETGVSKTITGLADGTTYYVWVKAKNSVGTSAFSPSASGTTISLPAAPAAPTLTAGDRQLTASWTAAAGATAYELWYGTTTDTGSAQKFGDDEAGVTKTITGLVNGTSYYVWVKAKNSVGTSAFSPSASGTPILLPSAPAAPAAPTVTAGDRQLTASWTAVAGATAYEVWYGTSSSAGSAQKFGDDETGVTKTIADLVNGTSYYVWVKAKNNVGTSAFSPSASGTPISQPAAPAAPTLSAGHRQLTASWTAVAGATAYEVWYGTSSNTASAQKFGDDETALAKTITDLANGTTYYVRVKAKNSVGTSGFSPATSGIPVVTYTVRANGEEDTDNSTAIIFEFSDTVTGLSPSDITVSPGSGSVTPGGLSGSGTNWSLALTALTSQTQGSVTVSITKWGIESETKTVMVYKASPLLLSDDATLSRFRPVGPTKFLRQHIVPKFAAANESYTLSVDYWINTFQLEVTTTEAGATVVSPTATATSRFDKAWTLSYALNNGDNPIAITVTAPNTVATKTYNIVINRDTFYGSGGSMATCTGPENVIPSWLLGLWAFSYGNAAEVVTITDEPVANVNNLGRLEFGMEGHLSIAGDIAYSREFGSRSGILILQLDPNAGASQPINDPTPEKTGYYAVYYFDKVGDGSLGSSVRIFQSNRIGSNGGVPAFATLEEAKTQFMVDSWYSVNLTSIEGVGDPQIKRPNDWEPDGTVDYWDD
jgi:hypothetical protein